MDAATAVTRVLREEGAPLHWTVIQDRALRAGYLDPFGVGDVRKEVLSAVAALRKDGVIRRVSTGVYEVCSEHGGAIDA
jgi:hypothetical protein